jgi:hypothetical protein
MRESDTLNSGRDDGWVAVARETFERSMLPWMGRKYEPWLRAWARPHPVDPGQVLVADSVYRVYAARPALEPLAQWQLKAMGYPRLPPAESRAGGAAEASPGSTAGQVPTQLPLPLESAA